MQNIPEYKVGHLGLVPQKNIFNLLNPRSSLARHRTPIKSHYQPFGTRRDQRLSKYMDYRNNKNEILMQSKWHDKKKNKICSKNSALTNAEEKKKKLPSLPTKVSV